MISNDKQCIFVHIPKTGGTSVEDAIWGPDWSARTTEDLWMGNIRPGFNKYQSGGLQHLLATQIKQEVGHQKFTSYFKFAFVRNPWDKVVSQFFYLKQRPMLRKYMGLGRWSSFGKYVNILQEHNGRHVQSFPQTLFLVDESGQLMVDYVGRFESLQTDFDYVAERLQLKTWALPHSMKSSGRKRYSSYYNRQTRKIVEQVYASDLEMFGYEFEED